MKKYPINQILRHGTIFFGLNSLELLEFQVESSYTSKVPS
jgi:hypothetical protein